MSSLKAYILDFFALIYPKVCFSCHKALVGDENCLCTLCQYEMPLTHLFREKENAMKKIFWGRVEVETATALFYFQKGGKVQSVIHQFKYKGKTELGFYLGNLLGQQINQHILWKDIDVVVPVPLHAHKLHKRGFNQSEVFGRGIAEVLGKPLVVDNLVRITKTDTQTRKTRFRRWQNVETVFHIANPGMFTGKNILLVDDVITTGSTLESCAIKLLQIPGTRVWLATIAMAL